MKKQRQKQWQDLTASEKAEVLKHLSAALIWLALILFSVGWIVFLASR